MLKCKNYLDNSNIIYIFAVRKQQRNKMVKILEKAYLQVPKSSYEQDELDMSEEEEKEATNTTYVAYVWLRKY